MITAAAVVALVLLFRGACLSGAPTTSFKPHVTLLSGIWLGFAAWLLGAVLHAWVPMWQMLVTGIALSASVAALRAKFPLLAQPVADFVAVAALGALSIIPVNAEQVVAAALTFVAAGFALDALRQGLRVRPPGLVLAMPAVLLLLLGLQVQQPGNFGSRLLAQDRLFPLRLVVALPAAGARVPLESGTTAAWLRKAGHGATRGTAIVMHGNHRLGSRQPSAMALQGALMRAGYDVLSVDHPGFGASLPPQASAQWNAWDPALGPTQALEFLRRDTSSPVRSTIVVGHSMGVDVALKFIASGASVQHAYLFGGSLDRPYGPNWLRGFHKERNIPCCLPEPTMQKIRDEFYGGGDRFAAALPGDHALVHYVRFGIEHADVTRDREPLYAAIPPPKRACDLANVSHYFNTLTLRRFVLLDTRTIRRTAEIFASAQGADAACASGGGQVTSASAF
jgi:pimeloyl-ACP methyl ester carboxylesterase